VLLIAKKFLAREISLRLASSKMRDELSTSNLAGIFIGSIVRQAREKFWRKGSVGVSRDGPNFLSTPYYLRNA